MSDSNILEVSDSSFKADVLDSEIPVIVDFWAPWCGPCKSIAPVLAELAEHYKGQVTFVKVNVDNNPLTPSQYNVRGIPNLTLFKGGDAVDQLVGALPKDTITSFIDKNL